MIGQAEAWQLAAETWSEVSASVSDEDWGKASTCDEWTVRDLVDHAVYWQGMAGRLLNAGTSKGDGWELLRPAISAALADPSALEGNDERFSNMPRHQVFGLMLTDLLVHSWDLATSIGVEISLPEDAMEAALLGLRRMPTELLRSPSMFAAEVDVPDDASAQDRFIAFVGRQP